MFITQYRAEKAPLIPYSTTPFAIALKMLNFPDLDRSLTPFASDWTVSRPKILSTYRLFLSRLEHQAKPTMRGSATERTPRTPGSRTSKRLRRLEPGTELDNDFPSSSTGLTPHISRTRIVVSSQIRPNYDEMLSGKTQDKQRHYTTPHPKTKTKRKLGFEPSPSKQTTHSYHYIPFSDILDSRTKRRIGRAGFSEEMNRIEETRRVRKRIEKEKDEEMQRLRDELNVLRSGRTPHYDTPDISGEDSDLPSSIGGDDMEVVFNEGLTDAECMDKLIHGPPVFTDAGTQVSFHSCRGEVRSLKEDLEQRKAEKKRLFHEWQGICKPRKQNGKPNDTDTALSTPPPDLAVQILASLREATTRAAEAAQTVETVQNALSSHGFDGVHAMEVIANIGSRFRHARIELERAVPGETANANLSNWSTTIDAMVERIGRFAADLKRAQSQVTGYQEREVALRRQFDAALLRYDETSKRNENLQKYTETIAEDMLNARIKLQKLEKEIQHLATDKSRLLDTLECYREDVRMLEKLNSQLEDEIAASRNQVDILETANNKLDEKNELSKARIASLERNLANEYSLRQKMQASLQRCNSEISSLRLRMEKLESEHDVVVTALKQKNTEQFNGHEKEIGLLNVRLSSVSTSLNNTRIETERLEDQKLVLQRRLADFEQLFSRDAIRTAQDRAKETVEAFEEWQRKVDLLEKASPPETHSFAIGSEPITPATVTRFKNVEIERGRKRRSVISSPLEEEQG
ncbi:hypothetical protein LOZ51_000420 [Ophidiomyces ophidiicola]|nr:hypothetical protein LOZ54_002097 [Ophidiomyces ophidiicola]KAI2003342.1 hypothetical protein LOZ51_000420 [Ophidiomyces ophidiicola]